LENLKYINFNKKNEYRGIDLDFNENFINEKIDDNSNQFIINKKRKIDQDFGIEEKNKGKITN
jgi:hypothetical protein